MNEIEKLACPEALGETALVGGDITVLVNIPVGAFPEAFKLLHPIMDDGAPHLEAWLIEEGRSEGELRILCALFIHLADNLPMDTKHFLDWLEKTGVDQYLDDFAARRVKRVARMKGDDPVDGCISTLTGMAWHDVARALYATFDHGELTDITDCLAQLREDGEALMAP